MNYDAAPAYVAHLHLCGNPIVTVSAKEPSCQEGGTRKSQA